MPQTNYTEESTREEFSRTVTTHLTAEGETAPFTTIKFQPITHPEAERIFEKVKDGRIDGATARDAAFFVFAHMRTNPGAAFRYVLTKVDGDRYTFRNAGETLAVLQIASVLESPAARFDVAAEKPVSKQP